MCADIGRTDLIRIAYVDSSEYAKLTSVTNRLPTPNKLKYSGKHHYSVYFTYASDANSNAISNEKKYELEWFFPLFFFYFPNSSGTSNERNTLAVSAGSRQLSKSFIFCGRTIIMSRFGSRCVANERSYGKFIDIYRVQKRSAVIIVTTRFLRCCLFSNISNWIHDENCTIFDTDCNESNDIKSRKKQFAPVLFCYHIENAPSIF